MSDDPSHPGSSIAHAHEPPALPEPHTPMWLPALGVALFVSVALWWAVTPKAAPPPASDSETVAAAAASGAASAAPQARPAPAGSVRTPDGGIDNAAVQRILDRLPKK